MYCGKCGHQNVDNSSFCAICGNKLNQQVATSYAANPVSQAKDMNRVSKGNKSGSNMTGKILFAVIGLAVGIAIGIGSFVILNSGSSDSSGKYEGKGFSTPEDAATAYIEAYGDGDIDKLVSCFAVESSVENYEMADMLERFKSYFPSATIKMPNYGETSKKLNIENKRADIIKTIIQHYVVMSGWELPLNALSTSLDDASAEDFVKEKFPNNEASITNGLKIDMVIQPEDILHDSWTSEFAQNNRKTLQDSFHAEDLTSRGVVFHTDDGYYIWYAGLIKYNNKWYVDPNFSTLSSMMGVDANHAGMVYIGTSLDTSYLW